MNQSVTVIPLLFDISDLSNDSLKPDYSLITISKNLQVSLVLTVSALTTVCNIFLFAAFAFNKHFRTDVPLESTKSNSVVDQLLSAIAVVCVVRVLVKGYIQAFCIAQGSWDFGDIACQAQAFSDSIVRHLFLWYLTILTLERYTNYRNQHEYALTFSSLNVKVILPGILLTITAQVTGPIYGWGEYQYIPAIGVCDLSLSSVFGPSYLTYTLTTLTIPPFVFQLVIWFCILLRGKHSLPQGDQGDAKDKDIQIPLSKSRYLEQQREIPIFFTLIIGTVILSSPRLIIELMVVTDILSLPVSSPVLFMAHFIETTTGLYYALVIILGHRVPWKARQLLLKDWTETQVSVKA